MFKVGDRVKLTPERFRALRGGQGVVDPDRIYTVCKPEPCWDITTNIFLSEIPGQGHREHHLIKLKPPVIIVRLNED